VTYNPQYINTVGTHYRQLILNASNITEMTTLSAFMQVAVGLGVVQAPTSVSVEAMPMAVEFEDVAQRA